MSLWRNRLARSAVNRKKNSYFSTTQNQSDLINNINEFDFTALTRTQINQQERETQKEDKNLKSLNEIPFKYRPLFGDYKTFNHVQSLVFDEIVHTDNSVVISAPTGSGKTSILELAIVRLMIQNEFEEEINYRVIYMAPLKALCNEKYNEWSQKFKSFNLKCIELTGDSDIFEDIKNIQNANIICTTPEKFDVITRRLNDKRSLVNSIKLFLIDEIHVLGEEGRGATIEVVVSRMKTCDQNNSLRFVAVSATIPNINDIAEWLGDGQKRAASVFQVNESYRPIPIRKVVIGYPCSDQVSEFVYDMRLSYKLADIIETYSNGKPTLIFCSTRKSVSQAASILIKDNQSYYMNQANKQQLIGYVDKIKDSQLKESLKKGVGVHHAGLNNDDRKLVENLFLKSQLRVLLCTSTLAIGVNFPAHLVIIKSTSCYSSQSCVEYSMTQIMQMIGRAGRPQFDTSATAVIMTKQKTKHKYELLVDGNQCIESNLHRNLIEHLNNEVVLRTITNIQIAIKWLKSTYLYIRLRKNPIYYGAKPKLNEHQVESYLEDLCTRTINALVSIDLVKYDENSASLSPTSNGILMSRYFVCYETMKSIITTLKGDNETEISSIEDLLLLVSSSKEFDDIKLRTSDKSHLNGLNKSKQSNTIRYSLNGRVKTIQGKVYVLIQAELGCLPITNDFSLVQDTYRIFRFATKISKCLMEYILKNHATKYELCLNSILLTKSLISQLWYDTSHIFRQFQRIGAATSQAFVDHNFTQFEQIESLTSLQIEVITKRNTPFGNDVLDIIKTLPKFEISIENVKHNPISTRFFSQEQSISLDVNIKMLNYLILKEKKGGYLQLNHLFFILVGDEVNNLLHFTRINLNAFLLDENAGLWHKRFTLDSKQNGSFLNVAFVSQEFVGLDQQTVFQVFEVVVNKTDKTTKSGRKKRQLNTTTLNEDDALDTNETTTNKKLKPNVVPEQSSKSQVDEEIMVSSKKSIKSFEYKKSNKKFTYENSEPKVTPVKERSQQSQSIKLISDYFKQSKPKDLKPDFSLKTELCDLFEDTIYTVDSQSTINDDQRCPNEDDVILIENDVKAASALNSSFDRISSIYNNQFINKIKKDDELSTLPNFFNLDFIDDKNDDYDDDDIFGY